MRELSTPQRILIEAQDLIQRFGFFGLSLQDLADRIHIRKPSLYAHYDSKENLGVSVVLEYDRQFREWAERLKSESPELKLREFYKMLEGYLLADKVCLNSSLSLEGARLPESMRKAYFGCLDTQIFWLEETLEEGQRLKIFLSPGTTNEFAKLTIQRSVGAQLMSRMTGEMSWFYRWREEMTKAIHDSHSTPSIQSPLALS